MRALTGRALAIAAATAASVACRISDISFSARLPCSAPPPLPPPPPPLRAEPGRELPPTPGAEARFTGTARGAAALAPDARAGAAALPLALARVAGRTPELSGTALDEGGVAAASF
jgi:hypothetical protein